jgi:hypothetical protein
MRLLVKKPKYTLTLLSILLTLAVLNLSAFAQSADEKNRIAAVAAGGEGVRWDIFVPYASVTVTISAPNGKVYSKEFRSGNVPTLGLFDKKGVRLPDGQYTYELRLAPALPSDVKKELAAAREKGEDAMDEAEGRVRANLPNYPLVQSGSFSVLRGMIVVGGASESGTPQAANKAEAQPRRLSSSRPYVQSESFLLRGEGTIIQAVASDVSNTRFTHPAFPDVVTADDEIIQGSLCVGLDCVNNESFGFDTIRLKENNTRIKFDDTSTSAGFPANDWQLTANDSASGGANKFSIEDITGSKVPFTITAGAATNSIFVDSTGRLGLRTSTPVLDVHANTSNTPAIRLEQNNSGGFTAQTWDIAGNEANFFVRDVTGGSRLPFRIRPGAPTSSVDISASGNVGIGTASPSLRLESKGVVGLPATTGTTQTGIARFSQATGTGVLDFGFGGNSGFGWIQAVDSTNLGTNFGLLLNPNGGNVGIGTSAPTDTLSVNGTASKPGGGSWSVFSDERLKNIRGHYTSGLSAVMQLQPLRYEYRKNNALGLKSDGEHIGFGAQAVQKIIPEAVTTNSQGYLLVNNDPIMWTMLNAIKEQQKEIEQLKAELQKLQARPANGNRSRHHRK